MRNVFNRIRRVCELGLLSLPTTVLLAKKANFTLIVDVICDGIGTQKLLLVYRRAYIITIGSLAAYLKFLVRLATLYRANIIATNVTLAQADLADVAALDIVFTDVVPEPQALVAHRLVHGHGFKRLRTDFVEQASLIIIDVLLHYELGFEAIGHRVSPFENVVLHLFFFNFLFNGIDNVFVRRLLLKSQGKYPLEHVSEVPRDQSEHLLGVFQLEAFPEKILELVLLELRVEVTPWQVIFVEEIHHYVHQTLNVVPP